MAPYSWTVVIPQIELEKKLLYMKGIKRYKKVFYYFSTVISCFSTTLNTSAVLDPAAMTFHRG